MKQSRVVVRESDANGEVVVVEDDKKRLKNGDVEVRGHWMARQRGGGTWRKEHKRRR